MNGMCWQETGRKRFVFFSRVQIKSSTLLPFYYKGILVEEDDFKTTTLHQAKLEIGGKTSVLFNVHEQFLQKQTVSSRSLLFLRTLTLDNV